MAREDLQYVFTSDYQDLASGVKAAIKLLDSYRAAFKKTDSDSKAKHSKETFKDLQNSLKNLSNNFASTNRQAKSLTTSLQGLNTIGGTVRKTLQSITGVALGNWFSEAVNQSIKFVENLNLFQVAMGESVDLGMKFVDTMSEIYGMDPSNLYRYAGYFYQLSDAIGMADSSSATLSLSLTKAANDLASLFNVDIETVVNNLASGMQGMTRAVRKYGIDIRATTLQQTAFNYGITQSVNTLSEADRQALRYITMMEQIKNATSQVVDETYQASGVMGDFARNIETPANQLRIFKEQVFQLGRAIGNFFIPMISKLLPILNGLVMAIRTVLTYLSALTGFSLSFGGTSKGAADTAKAISGIGEAAGGAAKAAKELKKTLAPFDELNLLQEPSKDTGGGGGGGGAASSDVLDPRLAEAISKMSLSLEDIEMKANKVRDSLLKFFGFDYVEEFNPDTGEFEKKLKWFSDQFKTNLINKFPQWSQTITALFANWSAIIDGIKNLFSSLGSVVDSVRTKIKNFADSLHLDAAFANAISGMADNLNSLSDWITKHSDQIANFILLLGGVVGAFKLFKIIKTYVAPLLAIGTQVASVVMQIVGFAAPILALVATFALLYTNSQAFAEAFKGLLGNVIASLEPIAESVASLVTRVWNSIQTLWTENLQPMIASIGDALAPIINTIGVLWNAIVSLFQSILDMLGNIWEGTIAPVIASISEAISKLMEVIRKLWTDVIGPILENVLKSVPEIYDNAIKPVVEQIIGIVGGLISFIMELWSHVLQPLVIWIINTLGPSISVIVNTIWNIISRLFQDISRIVANLLSVFRGVITFLTGVFSGNWRQAWKGIVDIFKGIFNSIVAVAQTILNGIISIINAVVAGIWSGVQTFVNSILSTINRIGALFGQTYTLQWTGGPTPIPYATLPQLATGGVVTAPTAAMIGEGYYDEAVIPLGNSPQMSDFADSIADRINNPEQVGLLREQNQLLRQILEKAGDSVGIRDLTRAVTRVQRQELRAGGI